MLATVCQNSVKIAHRPKGKKTNEKSLKNLKDNKTKKFSSNAMRRMKNSIDNLVDAETVGRFGINWKKYKKRINLIFVTLTLPVKQNHTDIELKKMLNYFLTELSKKQGNIKYVWKGEKQKNGNIHFHLLINKKIHYSVICKLWNGVLNRHGYIEEYRKKMQNMTLNEYINYRKKNEKIKHTQRHLDQYKKAYLRGKKTGWTSPNTTDVHSLYFIKSATAYISKYITKSEENINGRYWGCSDELRNYQYTTIIRQDDIRKLQSYSNKIREEKYYSVYYFSNEKILELLSFFLTYLLYVQTLYCMINGMQYSVAYMCQYRKRR